MTLIDKVRKTIRQYQMLDDGETVVVALSGGADSCTLLSVMAELKNEYHLKIIVAHFNHGTRGSESQEDETFCRKIAAMYNFHYETGKMISMSIPKGRSPEEHYRIERYRFLDQVATNCGAKKIALGHHLSDQAETVLINIIRGSGMAGLKGILPIRDKRYIRPLILVSKPEIETYLQKKKIQYRVDRSNLDNVFLRNRVRMELIPFLKERFNPRIEDALSKMAWIINRDHDYMNESLYQIVDRQSFSKDEHSVSFSTSLLAELPSAMQFRLVKELLKSMAACDHGIHYAHVHSVVNLALQEFTGKKISLPHGLVAERQYCSVIIRRKEVIEEEDFECALSIPGTVFLKDRNLIIHVRQGTLNEVDFGQKDRFFFDLDAIQGELTLRNRRPGDWFQPLGTVGRQKVKKLFIDHKIPRGNRNKKILLADEISVIWIECLHSSDRVKISDQTERVLILEIKSLTE